MSENSKLQKTLLELVQEYEKVMGDMAAFTIACRQLNISLEKGWEILAEGAYGQG